MNPSNPSKTDPRRRRCSYHKTDHQLAEFSGDQRWCREAFRAYRAEQRAQVQADHAELERLREITSKMEARRR